MSDFEEQMEELLYVSFLSIIALSRDEDGADE